MTEIRFKGKAFVHNHHLTVPHRLLEPHADKGIGAPRLNGNMIIQGDNLQALKALLPSHGGKVDCIYIDPPYNTGNEGWTYNDKVNSPMINEWLADNPINVDDMLRHDKWCAMMWPRLKMLYELLAETGVIFVSIDDNEVHRLRAMMDEIWGEDNFISNVIWQKKFSPQNDAKWLSDNHDHILVFAKDKEKWRPFLLERGEAQNARFSNPDNDPRGDWESSDLTRQEFRENDFYPIISPVTGKEFLPPEGASWGRPAEKVKELIEDNRIWFGEDGNNVPRIKRFLSEVKQGITPITIWLHEQVGHNQGATQELKKMGISNFATPKPSKLIGHILKIGLPEDGLILDSFAGSGTTAHAVLQANERDGGNRKFVLVEMEDKIADAVTAERVRRVINGYDFKGTQKTELMREKLNWKTLEKADALVAKVQSLEASEGENFDKITKQVKDDNLIVTGETKIAERTEGLGGEFTYYTLGNAVDLENVLTGKALPSYADMARFLFHAATNMDFDPSLVREEDSFIGETDTQMFWMLYQPDLDVLRHLRLALTLDFARTISQADSEKRHIVFAPANFTNAEILDEEGLRVVFAPLPYALFRINKD